MQTEPDRELKALWELHLNMEIEHLRIACDSMREIEDRDPAEFLPERGMDAPLTFEQNKDYVREVLTRTCEWTGYDAQFVPIGELPKDHRYFAYQSEVNEGGCPSERVIEEHRAKLRSEYRREGSQPHPIESLRESGPGDRFPYAQAVANSQPGATQ